MVTVRPHLETDVGKKNLENFLFSNNVSHYHITVPFEVMRKIIN